MIFQNLQNAMQNNMLDMQNNPYASYGAANAGSSAASASYGHPYGGCGGQSCGGNGMTGWQGDDGWPGDGGWPGDDGWGGDDGWQGEGTGGGVASLIAGQLSQRIARGMAGREGIAVPMRQIVADLNSSQFEMKMDDRDQLALQALDETHGTLYKPPVHAMSKEQRMKVAKMEEDEKKAKTDSESSYGDGYKMAMLEIMKG